MRKSVLGLALLSATALSAPAFAQDAGGHDWTGAYWGVNAGGAWGRANQSYSTTGGSYLGGQDVTNFNNAGNTRNKSSGFTGGAQIGWNWQLGPNMVWGVEGDFNALDLNRSSSVTTAYTAAPGATYTQSQGVRTRWLATIRPRIGWTMNGNNLLYATGGVAMADIRTYSSFSDNLMTPGAGYSSSKSTRTGWTAGVGDEMALTNHMSVKAEYLYADLGHNRNGSTITGASGSAPAYQTTHFKANILRVGLNWRF